ncbi:spore germination protein GerPB [Cohnella algarum]|uniref:spore germination protein GerPB n=1 Tax=Cohnella algarum TaxID=2044859 RepID=UPI001F085291|nr:spore germination protein GerPB [Cohnella algarum]
MIQWNVHQQITIQQLRVDAVTNSSVLQIGSAGSIQSLSQLYNMGGYTGPAAPLGEAGEGAQEISFVPLPNPS